MWGRLVRAGPLLLTAATAFGVAAAVPAATAAPATPAAPAEIWVALGTHTFGQITPPSAIVARARADQVGFVEPQQGSSFGPWSFDVAADGVVWLLDELNDRILAWEPGRAAQFARSVAVPVATFDFAVARDGDIYVTVKGSSRELAVQLRRMSPTGTVRWTAAIHPDSWAGQLRFGGNGALYQVTAGTWRPLTTPDGAPLPVPQQSALPVNVQPYANGRLMTAYAAEHELAVAVLDGAGQPVRRWRITSASTIAQTWATPAMLGNDPIVPMAVYGAERNGQIPREIVVLRLTGSGASVRLHLPFNWWGDDPITALRLGRDGALYQMWLSRTDGVTVVRYPLTVAPVPVPTPTGGAVVLAPSPTQALPTPVPTAAPAEPAGQESSPAWWLWALGGVAAVALIATAWLIWRWRRRRPVPVDLPPIADPGVGPPTVTDADDTPTVQLTSVGAGRHRT